MWPALLCPGGCNHVPGPGSRDSGLAGGREQFCTHRAAVGVREGSKPRSGTPGGEWQPKPQRERGRGLQGNADPGWRVGGKLRVRPPVPPSQRVHSTHPHTGSTGSPTQPPTRSGSHPLQLVRGPRGLRGVPARDLGISRGFALRTQSAGPEVAARASFPPAAVLCSRPGGEERGLRGGKSTLWLLPAGPG